MSLTPSKQAAELVEERNTAKDLRQQLPDLRRQVSTTNHIIEAKEDYILDLQDELGNMEKELKGVTGNLIRKTEYSDVQENKVISLTEVVTTLEIEKTQAKAEAGKTKAELIEAQLLLVDKEIKLAQKSRQVHGLLESSEGKFEEIRKLKKQVSLSLKVPQSTLSMDIEDEIKLEEMQCMSTEKAGYTEEDEHKVDEEVFKHHTIMTKNSKAGKKKWVPVSGVRMSDERRRCTSSCLLRVLGRMGPAQRGGERLVPLAGLQDYTRERIVKEGIIHDVVAGVRLVTEGAKTEKVFAIRARTRKCKGVRISYQEKVAEITDYKLQV